MGPGHVPGPVVCWAYGQESKHSWCLLVPSLYTNWASHWFCLCVALQRGGMGIRKQRLGTEGRLRAESSGGSAETGERNKECLMGMREKGTASAMASVQKLHVQTCVAMDSSRCQRPPCSSYWLELPFETFTVVLTCHVLSGAAPKNCFISWLRGGMCSFLLQQRTQTGWLSVTETFSLTILWGQRP